MLASTIVTQEFESSNIHSALYEMRARELFVRFHSGDAIYVYEGVPEPTWDELRSARSAGAFFNAEIRGEYPSSRLTA